MEVEIAKGIEREGWADTRRDAHTERDTKRKETQRDTQRGTRDSEKKDREAHTYAEATGV